VKSSWRRVIFLVRSSFL